MTQPSSILQEILRDACLEASGDADAVPVIERALLEDGRILLGFTGELSGVVVETARLAQGISPPGVGDGWLNWIETHTGSAKNAHLAALGYTVDEIADYRMELVWIAGITLAAIKDHDERMTAAAAGLRAYKPEEGEGGA